MKIALIGLGDIAQKAYLPTITQRSDVELVLCTRNQTTLDSLAKRFRIHETVQDYRALPSLKVDAVMIHSATSSHFEIASFFLKQRIASFVDKPLADDVNQVEQLYDLAEQYATPLYVGFNRRHLPILTHHLPHLQQGPMTDLRVIRWEKHRYQLPGDIRTFIFDDFIHPLDSVNLCAQSTLDNVQMTYQMQGAKLSRLEVQWQNSGTLYQAVMDREFGHTNERVQIALTNQSYEFPSFTQGQHAQRQTVTQLQLPDWTPMIDSKGFAAMIDDWLTVVRCNQLAPAIIERNLASHRLADAIYQKIVDQLS
ncbi:Gfo/Idh/MocA family oxidoreductase [Vibrio sp. SM6]|uniref:Gfo/Idh/MocA family oxidoreductase n=1 Tax=Vibrio agarilyticus TaxID=2726741 RepID=A0A7X8TS34_9VIBR|nr:Gfo/Idh/MocA family oxidoreductase [Vibrio agarilyticus]NLS13769.1 Gfo/Idh/MocA family oxidoreductase [Vibrio agarilyticus]